MIPTKTDIEIEGSLPGEDVQMTLDSNSLEHLMTVLSNLYSDKPLAVVREYSTNARDSHIEAGVDRPIEVTTPSDFKPYFVVRDYGVGMDAETIRNVYSRYGASTKRGTNTQNGMLGLGSKSALTYTTQFNITGIKNGIKTNVVVSRAANGSGSMKIIGQKQTDECNGVTIQIPVSNRREIENVAHNFFRFWPPGTVLLNGKDPSKLNGLELGKFIVVDNLGGVDYIVMGNVAYPIPADHRIFKYGYSRNSVVAFVDMGEVNFTPSRESLHMTELTKSTLDSLRFEFTVLVKQHLIDALENAPSHAEALKSYFELQKSNLSVYAGNLKYKGEDIPENVRFKWVYHLNAGTVYEAQWVEIKRMLANKVVIVYGYEYDKVHTTHRQKLRLWLEANNMTDTALAYFNKDIPLPQWLTDITKVSWENVKAHKIIRPKSGNVSNELFDAISDRGYRISGQKIDKTKTVIFDTPTAFASDESRDLVARFLTNRSDVQFVLVNKNKWKAFKTEIPKAVHFDDAVKSILDDYVNNLTAQEKMYLGSNWKDRKFCARLDANKVLDPNIKAAIGALNSSTLSDKTTHKYELMHKVAVKWDYVGFPRFYSQSRLFDEYVLLDVYGHHSVDHFPLDHIYLYMNSCYEENLIVKN